MLCGCFSISGKCSEMVYVSASWMVCVYMFQCWGGERFTDCMLHYQGDRLLDGACMFQYQGKGFQWCMFQYHMERFIVGVCTCQYQGKGSSVVFVCFSVGGTVHRWCVPVLV